MAKKTIFVSDISGEKIPEGKGARVTIKFADARKRTIVLDVTVEEAAQLAKKGQAKQEQVASRILELLAGGPMPSTTLHAQIQNEFGVKALLPARELLGRKVQTGVRSTINGRQVSHWRLAA